MFSSQKNDEMTAFFEDAAMIKETGWASLYLQGMGNAVVDDVGLARQLSVKGVTTKERRIE